MEMSSACPEPRGQERRIRRAVGITEGAWLGRNKMGVCTPITASLSNSKRGGPVPIPPHQKEQELCLIY